MSSGLRFLPAFLNHSQQRVLAKTLAMAIAAAPFFTPVMPGTGRPFSVRMTNLGKLGWVSDRAGGYRYQATHPETGKPWPDIPEMVLEIWRKVSDYPHDPEACLVNYYGAGARMGLHRDVDEEDIAAPVVSISLGDTAVFRLGGIARGGKTETMRLSSGDVLVMGGASRLRYHGIDRVVAGTSTLIEGGGRINLTLRRVTRPSSAAKN